METALLLLIEGTFCIVSFFVGAKVGQKVVKGETIETPNLNPIDIIHQQKEKREARAEKEKYDTILKNIDSYDGTPYGQMDVPR